MEIRPIQIREVNITSPQDVLSVPNQSVLITPPVTVQIGLPVVDIPGCVQAHESNNNSKKIGIDDSNGLVTYCDGSTPSFNPIEYNPEEMTFGNPAGVPLFNNTPKKEEPEPEPPRPVPVIPPTAPQTAIINESTLIECPSSAQNLKEPVGSYVEGFKKKVSGYKIISGECVRLTTNVSIPEQIVAGVPSAGMFMNTGGIAVVATTSALLAKPLADILLKVVKPTVKKVMKKISSIRGKSVPVLSVKDRRDEQRLRSHAIRKLKGKE